MEGLIALVVLVFIHLFANQAKVLGWVWHGRFLSFAAGLSFAYVFVDLLPTLAKGQPLLKQTLDHFLPLLDKHSYVVALSGVLFYYGIESLTTIKAKKTFWISLSGYLLFNLFVGASLADAKDPEMQPLTLFTIALGMHYFVKDHYLREKYLDLYEKYGKWFLVSALFIGYFLGILTNIPDSIVALTISFIAGGVIFNVLHYELPQPIKGSYLFFIGGAIFYTLLILNLGTS